VQHGGHDFTIVVTSDGEGLVSYAGGEPLAEASDRLGTTEAISRRPSGMRERRSNHDPGHRADAAPDRIVIDIDATLIWAHSEKDGAAGTFKGGLWVSSAARAPRRDPESRCQPPVPGPGRWRLPRRRREMSWEETRETSDRAERAGPDSPCHARVACAKDEIQQNPPGGADFRYRTQAGTKRRDGMWC